MVGVYCRSRNYSANNTIGALSLDVAPNRLLPTGCSQTQGAKYSYPIPVLAPPGVLAGTFLRWPSLLLMHDECGQRGAIARPEVVSIESISIHLVYGTSENEKDSKGRNKVPHTCGVLIAAPNASDSTSVFDSHTYYFRPISALLPVETHGEGGDGKTGFKVRFLLDRRQHQPSTRGELRFDFHRQRLDPPSGPARQKFLVGKP